MPLGLRWWWSIGMERDETPYELTLRRTAEQEARIERQKQLAAQLERASRDYCYARKVLAVMHSTLSTLYLSLNAQRHRSCSNTNQVER